MTPDIKNVFSQGAIVEYAGRQPIFQKGDSAEQIALLVKGRVLEYETQLNPYQNSRFVSHHIYYPRAVFGGYEEITRTDYAHNIRALEPSVVLLIPKERFTRDILGNPELFLTFAEQMAKRQRFAERAIGEIISIDGVAKRLARFLLKLEELDHEYGIKAPGQKPTRNLLKQEEMGGFISTTREETNRCIRNLIKSGLLQVGSQNFSLEVTNWQQLTRFASSQTTIIAV